MKDLHTKILFEQESGQPPQRSLRRFVPDDNVDSPSSGLWMTRFAGGLAGTLFALGILLILPRWLHWPYVPPLGIQGPPALTGRDPAIEVLYYLAALVLFLLAGGVGIKAAGARFGTWAMPLIIFLELAALAVGYRHGWIPTSSATGLIGALLRSPWAISQLAVFVGGAMWLLSPPRWPNLAPSEEQGGITAEWQRLGSQVAGWAERFFPLCFLLALWLGGTIPIPLVGAIGAVPLAIVLERLIAPPAIRRRHRHLSQLLELIAYGALSLAPLLLIWMRYARTVGQAVPDTISLATIGILVTALTVGATLWRHWCDRPSRVRPVWLLPVWLVMLFMLASGVSHDYDAYHQGEYIYAAQALSRGLIPWRDVFFVHGLGANTLPGYFMQHMQWGRHSLDLFFVIILNALASGSLLLLCLKAWGRRWWLAALAVPALLTIGAGPPAHRYLGLWLMLLCLTRYLESQRFKWLMLAGIVSAGWVFYSLDTGALAVLVLLGWAGVWGMLNHRRPQDDGEPINGSWPLIAVLLGLGVIGLPVLVMLLWNGLWGEVVQLHLDYLAVKRHYDNLPFQWQTLVFGSGPLVIAFGAVSLWGSLRHGIVGSSQARKLTALSLALIPAAALSYLRALDRSDAGHIYYAMLPSWVLAVTLVVQAVESRWPHLPHDDRFGRRRVYQAALRIAGARGLVVACLIILLGYAHPLLSGRGLAGSISVAAPVHWLATFFAAHHDQPISGRLESGPWQAFAAQSKSLQEMFPGVEPWTQQQVTELYDFSNQPALYAWTGLTAPSRFYAAFYAASEKWQNEIIADLERKQPQWIVWRGPEPYFNAPDGMPNWVRHPVLAGYLLRNYRPARMLPGDGPALKAWRLVEGWAERRTIPDADPYSDWDMLLARRVDRPTSAPAEFAPLWLDAFDLAAIPAGQGRSMADALKGDLVASGSLSLSSGQLTSVTLGDEAWRATHLELHLDPPVDGGLRLRWENAQGESAGRALQWRLERSVATYPVDVGSSPAWVWGGAPTTMTLRLITSAIGPVRVNYRLVDRTIAGDQLKEATVPRKPELEEAPMLTTDRETTPATQIDTQSPSPPESESVQVDAIPPGTTNPAPEGLPLKAPVQERKVLIDGRDDQVTEQ